MHTIVSGCVDPAGRDLPNRSKHGEFVQIKPDGSLAGHVMEHLVDPSTSREHFEPYMVFESDFTYPVATRSIIVHSGTGKRHLDANNDYHVYVDGDRPSSGRYYLNNDTGDHVRLKNPQGTVVTEKVFQPHQCDIPQKVPGKSVLPAVSLAPAFGPLNW